MTRTLIFDPFSGISGDMAIAALLDLGLDDDWLRTFVHDLGIGAVDIRIERVQRCGIAAPHVEFVYPPEHAHRHLHDVNEIIDASTAPDRAKRLAQDAFRRMATAEAKVHGTTIEKVHFHEVGAMDAILDVVCCMAAVCQLGFDDFRTRAVAIGHGWIDMEHGRYPVPAPATLELLEGITLTGTELAGECTTPTGAAILATLTQGRPAPASFTSVRTGFGAGSRDTADRPNVLRLIHAAVEADGPTAQLWIMQADIDDMSPEYAAIAQTALFEAGAADAVLVHVTMKKGRAGLRLEALCTADRLAAVERAFFTCTSTIGVRRWPVERAALSRRSVERDWRGQRIRFKQVRLPDGTTREKPELDDIVAAATAIGVPAWQVYRELAALRGSDAS